MENGEFYKSERSRMENDFDKKYLIGKFNEIFIYKFVLCTL